MIEFNKCSLTIIYINYLATIFISRQINLTIFIIDKLNLRLIRASQYLFDFNLLIKYKFNKFGVVFNVLLYF